jgi:RimJ/RimL family protein N-acetyltransferase
MIRKLRFEDTSLILEWMHDDRVNKYYQCDFAAMTECNVKKFIENSQSEENKHFAFTDENDNYVGTISLKNISVENGSAEYAIVTSFAAQGKGYAYEATRQILKYAFTELKLNRIYLNVLTRNERANAFYKKCGFKYEGTFRKHCNIKGKFEDLNWYSMLREEYSI